jgi:two-component sensor histidine kinase
VDFKLTLSRLTGRHILGPGVFFSTLGYGLLAHLLGSSDLPSGNVATRFISVLVAHIAMMTVLYLTRFLAVRLGQGLFALIFVFLGYIIAGAVRGLTLQALLFEFGAADSGFSIYRLLGGVLVMTTGAAWAGFAFGVKAEWSQKRANLKATETQLETLLAASESRFGLQATDTMSTIESMLQTALIPELMVTPQHAVTKLQSLINDTLRPLSAFLASSQAALEVAKLDPSVYRFRWRTLMTHLTLRDASQPLLTAGILSVLAVTGFVRYIPKVSPFVLLLLSIVSIAALLAITKYWLSRLVDRLPSTTRAPVVLAILFFSAFLSGLGVMTLSGDPVVAVSLATNAGVAAALLGSLFGINKTAKVEMAEIDRKLMDHEYRLRWTIAALNGRHWLQKKQFARKLHGPIQSEVAAAAIRIERSLSSGEVTEAGEEILQNLRDRLAKILQDTAGTNEIGQVMDEIIETWQGLCDIELEMSDEVQRTVRLDPVCVETVLEIAREACSNAIRHGSADQVKINLSIEGSDLVKIEVRNNGTKGILATRRGLGSTYLDDCTYSHKLETLDGETMLTATVPLQVKPSEFQV